MTHLQVQLQATHWLLGQTGIAIAAPEVDWHGIGRVDVLGLTHGHLPLKDGRVAVVEAKATAGDLRKDLKVGKMFRYEHWATHCYLAIPPELLEEALEKMPAHWGLVVCKRLWFNKRAGRWDADVTSKRSARRIQETTPALLKQATQHANRSLSWRVFRLSAELDTLKSTAPT